MSAVKGVRRAPGAPQGRSPPHTICQSGPTAGHHHVEASTFPGEGLPVTGGRASIFTCGWAAPLSALFMLAVWEKKLRIRRSRKTGPSL
ncbi:hypothetical protein AVEN_135901-1 [Araneus ventricosus]|uniref:Uncharacterized protein n=1 Tax=Araneus ventricosus TaxID=182803 RepID=A0A4Y2VU04_ARAVE|nr:hypothetical protein AVEN_232261-1 [Araneus ventricosus]GBO28893.1 hypothetical protein AVEN_135901-1 [Araneus ventricosus]